MPRVMEYAADLVANVSPASMATVKHQVNTELRLNIYEATERAEGLMRESLKGDDVVEGVSSFMEKRQVAFPILGEGTQFDWMND